MRDRQFHPTDKAKFPASQRTGKSPTPERDARETLAPQPDPIATRLRNPASVSAQAAMLNRAPSLASRSLLQLQRQHGNRYVQRVLAISRQGEESGEVSPEVEAGIQRQRGGGQALERPVKSQMESAFGTDFSSVRVHADTEANKLNEALNARAFTTGQDIFFRQGEYSPHSSQGKELLAHELTHTVQQAGGIQGKLKVSQPGDKSEQEADRVALNVLQQLQQANSLANQKTLTINQQQKSLLQRLRIPLSGWGDVPEFADSSEMNINPRVLVLSNGREIARRNFADNVRESISLPLGSDIRLQFSADVSVLRDDPIVNNENSWSFQYTWRITVSQRGQLQISPPVPEWSGGAGDVPWSVQAQPVQDDRTVGLNLTLASLEASSSAHTVPINIGGAFEPFGVGVEAQGGYQYSWGTSSGSTLTAGRGFIVDLETPTPPPEARVEFGEVTMTRKYDFYFATNRATLDTNPDTGVSENIRLTNFLHSLDQDNNGGSNISGFVDGYASPRGDTERNRDLARRRADYLLSRIQDTLPRGNFQKRVYGEDIWKAKGVPEVDDSQRHRVVILTVTRTFEG